jgi:hypothetical protein
LTPEEQTLFQTSLAHYQSKRHTNPNMLGQLKKFVEEIENFIRINGESLPNFGLK